MDKEEREALEEFIAFSILFGMAEEQASEMATGLLDQAITESRQEGTYRLQNHGDFLLGNENDPRAKEIRDFLGSLRQEGTTDEDIRWYYNMNDIKRRILSAQEQVSRMALTNQYEDEQGLSVQEAVAEMRKFMPIYGYPRDTPDVSGDDRPLPHALQKRIDLYTQRRREQDPLQFQRDVHSFSSFNAFIRHEIRHRKLDDVEKVTYSDPESEINEFESKIGEYENHLFGMALFSEGVQIMWGWDKNVADISAFHSQRVISREEEAVGRAKRLLEYVKKSPHTVAILGQFEFPPIHGHPVVEELAERAKILVDTYDQLFPGRPRGKPLTEDEKYLLLETAAGKWEP